MLRNWSKWSISFRSIFSKRNIGKFRFEEKISKSFRKMWPQSSTIEIFRNTDLNDRNFSKFVSKNFEKPAVYIGEFRSRETDFDKFWSTASFSRFINLRLILKLKRLINSGKVSLHLWHLKWRVVCQTNFYFTHQLQVPPSLQFNFKFKFNIPSLQFNFNFKFNLPGFQSKWTLKDLKFDHHAQV